MSDTIVVMNNGRVEQQGSAEEIFEQPRTRFVATFMGAQILANTGIAGGDATSTRLRIGPHEITVPKALPSGAREITIVARPGKIRLNSPNGWPATVTDRVYKGAVITYQLALGDGTPITADVAHDMPGHRHAVGDAVTIGIRPEDLVVIPEPLQSA